MVAVGVYGVEALQSVRFAIARLLVAVALGILAPVAGLLPVPAGQPSGAPACSTRPGSPWSRLVGGARVLRDALGGERFKRRVLVLGAGARAARIEALAGRSGASFAVVGFVGMNDGPAAVAGAVNRADIASLPDHLLRSARARWCWRSRSGATRCRSNDLLRIKTTGVARQRFLQLPRARDRPGRSRQPQSLLADLLRRLLGRPAAVERRQAAVRHRRQRRRSWS